MDMKIVNAPVATVLKIDVHGVELSVSYNSDGTVFNGDCRVYIDEDQETTDITGFVFNTNFRYIDSFEELVQAVDKVKEWIKRNKREKQNAN